MRRDIQGLRALAVIAVIADHLFHRPSGGFVGVDVFFVISGFLITGLLLREADRTGSLSFVSFYKRRIKRILPAATLVIIVTIAAGFLLFSGPRAVSTAWDGFWAFFFSANWNSAIQGTDYFDAAAAPSPLQHYWSLSVEEQFYFVWPWLMLGILAVGARLSRWTSGHTRFAIGVALGILVVASFAWSSWESIQSPTVAYFSTVSRAWELGVGGLLAVAATTLARLPDALRPLLAWLGLGGIVLSMFVLNTESVFPAPGAALPVLSAALVIVAGLGGRQRYLYPLTNPVSNYLGDISYSLYLWHFPVIILLATVFPTDEPFYFVICLVVMLLLSIFAYHLVEDPIRKSSWLSGRSRQENARIRRSQGAATPQRGMRLAGIGLLASVCVALVGTALAPATVDATASTYVPPSAPATSVTASLTVAQLDRQKAIRTALSKTAWPDLTPNLDAFTKKGRGVLVPAWMVDGCLADDEALYPDPIQNAEHCVYGNPDGQKTAVLYGDSIAISYLEGVRAALGDEWRILVYTMASCPYSETPVNLSGGEPSVGCATFRAWVLDQVAAIRPQLIVVSQYGDEKRLQSGAAGLDAVAEYGVGANVTLPKLAAATTDLVVLARPQATHALLECATPNSKPAKCIGSVGPGHLATVKSLAAASSAAGVNVRFIDTTSWFCYSGDCPSFIDNVPVRADIAHLTEAESASLGPLMREVLLPTT